MDRIEQLLKETKELLEFDEYVEQEKKRVKELTYKQYDNEKRKLSLMNTLSVLYSEDIKESFKGIDGMDLGGNELNYKILELVSKLHLKDKLGNDLEDKNNTQTRSKI